jgi:hypothetical protein
MQERFDYQFGQSRSSVAVINAFMRGVYRWMGVGLALTAVVAGLITGHMKSLPAYELEMFIGRYSMIFFGC